MSDKTGWNAAANVTIKLLEVKLETANARLAQMEKLLREVIIDNRACLNSVYYPWRAKALEQFPELGTK